MYQYYRFCQNCHDEQYPTIDLFCCSPGGQARSEKWLEINELGTSFHLEPWPKGSIWWWWDRGWPQRETGATSILNLICRADPHSVAAIVVMGTVEVCLMCTIPSTSGTLLYRWQ